MPPAPVVTLAIENSNPSARYGPGDGPGVAVGEMNGAGGMDVLGVEFLGPVGRNNDDLMPAIDRLTRRLGIAPAGIGRVAVSVGPGGYTALRIAVATAKMIAEAVGAETVAVPTAQAAARLVTRDTAAGRFAIALASKGESVFLTVFGGGRRVSGLVAGASDLAALATGDDAIGVLVADQFLPEGFHRAAGELRLRIEALRLNPVACLEASVGLSAVDPGALVPLYSREPEAVTLWRGRKG